jgi:6-phosphofructokinase 1
MIKKIGILTSGGDAPGMNACIRAIVRTANFNGINVIGFKKGYEGLIDNDFIELNRESVSGIIQRGGTIIKTARSKRFMTDNGLELAKQTIEKQQLDGMILIGGDGTFKGAIALNKIVSIPIIGCAGTIDNDLVGTDFTIGYDTAINTVVEAVDKIRDTAESHDRIFVVEVMGRDAGLIAMRSSIASGADAVMIPEIKKDTEQLIEKIKTWRKTKTSRIIIVAEGDEAGGAYKLADKIKSECTEFDIRVTILGHIQRGGNPSCMDRVNASIVGYNAVLALLDGKKSVMVGVINKQVTLTAFENVVKHIDTIDENLEKMIEILSS